MAKKIVSSPLFPVCNRSNLTTRNFDILRDLSLPANVSSDDDPEPQQGEQFAGNAEVNGH